ncbi:MAG TPA: S-layer homology domain-containing protein [Chloroflexia bacterium]|nr:S-layer homology domain-containing protein [Chloroflexia bacterium]
MAILLLAGSLLAGPRAQAAPERPAAPQSRIILPGDLASGPAGANQALPEVALGNGSYLVVWEDSRTNFTAINGITTPDGGEPGGQGLRDIFAARVGLDGQPIDTTPITIAQASGDQMQPAVAWNGQNWLIVWTTQRVASTAFTLDVLAARVSPAGVLLDPVPITIDGTDAVDEWSPAVASDGTNWVVLWQDQGTYFELDAARVANNGTVLDPAGVPLYTPGFPYAPAAPSLAFAGDEFLVTWSQWGSSDNDIVGLRMTPALQRIGPAFFPISTGPNNQYTPSVASNGNDFFVVWHDQRFSQLAGVYGARVTHAGTVLDPAGIELVQDGGYPTPNVIWDGAQWIAGWDDRDASAAYIARISPTGTVLDPQGRVVGGNADNGQPGMAPAPGGGAYVAWTTFSSGPYPDDITGALVAADGAPGAARAVSVGAPAQRKVDLASNGNGALAVFISEVSGEARIKGQRLDANGNAVDAEPFLIQGGSATLNNPAVAWNGTRYLVVWEDNTQIYGRRVAADGTVLDGSPIAIMPGNTPDVAAGGDTFLVVDTHEPTNHIRYPKAVRVSSDGVVIGAPVIIGASFAVNPSVVGFGGRWLAVWQSHPTHDNPASSIVANFVNADGTPVGTFGVTGATARRPDVAVGNTTALVVYYKNGDVYGRRIAADGTLLDGADAIRVTQATNNQFQPAVGWNGSEWVVAYEDYRAFPALSKPMSDIYAARVAEAGTVLDPTGFALANDLAPEIQPAVAALPGGVAVAYSDFLGAAPYAAYRIAVETLPNSNPPPTARPSDTPIPSPTPGCDNYAVATGTGAQIVPGTLDIGLHCVDCRTTITLPFTFTLYDRTFTTATVSPNGAIQFLSQASDLNNTCLPYSQFNYAIMPFWDFQYVDEPGTGVFTSVTGNAPNRIFNIEWRTAPQIGGTANYEVRLYENDPNARFDVVIDHATYSGSATIGVQRGTGQRFTQYLCNTYGLPSNLLLTFTLGTCPPTATPQPPTATRTTAPPSTTVVPPTGTAPPPTVTRTTVPPTATRTPAPPSATPQASATPCTVQFSDVDAQNPFYAFVRCLVCRGILSGYADGTFRPYANLTRGQAAKIVANAANLQDAIPSGQQTFSDVPNDTPFWLFIERMAGQGYISGYADGTFHPNAEVTRSQLAKIVANAGNMTDVIPSGRQTFHDVPAAHPFYIFVERVALHGIISGYTCGGGGEPCDPQNRPYFRPYSTATRGQAAKIVANTFFPGCETPGR